MPVRGELSGSGDKCYYGLSVTSGEHIFALLDKDSRYYTYLSIREGSLPEVGSYVSYSDQGVELITSQAGYCYVRVQSGYGGGTFSITAYDEDTFPRLTIGQPLANQELKWEGDCQWYQVKLALPGPFVVRVDKSIGWCSNLRIKKGSFPIEQSYWSDSGCDSLEMSFLVAEAGTYYIFVKSDSYSGGHYSILATTDINEARKPLILDNEVVRTAVSVGQACVTSLVFKKGSNTELIVPYWGSYIINFGSIDTRLGKYLKTGWSLENMDVQTNYLWMSFKHHSGFANEMVLSWTMDHVELRCDITAPEPVEIFNALFPGGDWESGRDRWAFPTAGGIETGSFIYPGNVHSPLYPPDHSWGMPSEGWVALWDNQVNEVYGFTFSGGVKAKICNGRAADVHFLLPSGNLRIAFHVVKPKPAIAYEAIRALTSGPYLTLDMGVDKLFASAGSKLNYILTFQNTGDADATDVVIEDTLPAELEIVEGSISNGGTFDPATRCIVWNVASVPAGAAAQSVTFKAEIAQGTADGAKITNIASIWANEQPIATNASVTTTIAPAPIITSISPNKGGNTGMVTVIITGRNLDPKAEVKLVRGGEEDIIATFATGLHDGTHLTATFDLTGKMPGVWDLAVKNPDDGSTKLPSAFTIEKGGEPKLWVEIVGREQIRIGRNQKYLIYIGNDGEVDADYLLLNINFSHSIECVRVETQGNIIWDVAGNSEEPMWILIPHLASKKRRCYRSNSYSIPRNVDKRYPI